MAAYICKGTVVKNKDGFEGKVLTVDNVKKVAVIRTDRAFSTEYIKDLKVVSYKEVE